MNAGEKGTTDEVGSCCKRQIEAYEKELWTLQGKNKLLEQMEAEATGKLLRQAQELGSLQAQLVSLRVT